MEVQINDVLIYTDGGCYNNGERKGDGSYAFLVHTDSTEYVDVMCEFVNNTTNNRTEMAAVIEGIRFINNNKDTDYPRVTIVSDSGYLVKGYTDPAYLDRWVTNGWKTSTNKPVQNIDLWQELQRLSWHVGFNFIHIRGHNKDANKNHAFWNDICDRACTEMLKMQKSGFLFTLRYHFKSKQFEQISVKLTDRKEYEVCSTNAEVVEK